MRLGGRRLSRRLLRAALTRNPSNPKVRYFTQWLHRRGWGLLDELRSWEVHPDLEGADANTQASWLASQAVVWASLRDFARAHVCIERAKSLATKESWVFSCASDVLGLEDRRDEALQFAQISWEMNPGTPYAARSLGESLVNLRRIREAAERLSNATEGCESFELAQIACWHMCALAETAEGEERGRVLARAQELAEQASSLAPLADRETRVSLARSRLDIAELQDDHAGMERWADEVRSPFHRNMLDNLRKNPDGLRIRMPFRRAIQKHDECLPTSVASALAAMGMPIDAEAMAAEITFGGTPEWAAAEWLEKKGLEVRFFAVTADVASRLIKNGIAFVVTLEVDANAHAVAVVGLDAAAGTLIVHDPSMLRTTEYLLESLGKDETPLGPRAMAMVPRDQAAELDGLLPKDDAEAAAAKMAYQRAIQLGGPAATREVVEKLAERLPTHPVTRLLIAMQAVEDGKVGVALLEFQKLLQQFPGSALVRARLLASCRSLGDTALMRRTLAGVVERGIVPGVQSQQSWWHPPSAYVSEYADLLRESAETKEQARTLLYRVLAREGSCAQVWHTLADLLWDDRDCEGAVLAYRLAAGLAANNEHYARAYSYALGNLGRQDEGLNWLEHRVRSFGRSSRAIATWITWINALEDWGHPERALAAAEESLTNHGASPELLGFVVPFLARMGHWEEADGLLSRLKDAGNSGRYHEAASDFHRRKGELEKGVQHAEAWVQESPLSMEARRELLRLVAKKDGTDAAADLAARWLVQHPGHDDLEQLYSQYLDSDIRAAMEKVCGAAPARETKSGRRLGVARDGLQLYRRVRIKKRKEPRKIATAHPCPDCGMRSDGPGRRRNHARARSVERGARAMGRSRCALDEFHQTRAAQLVQLSPGVGVPGTIQCGRAARDLAKTLGPAAQLPGRLDAARETIVLVAQRFGVSSAEETVSAWNRKRPHDPEVTEAYADLLLEQGHGRTDAQRALDLLQPAVARFPYHLGLRFSLASAQRKLGKFQEAEQTLQEIIRRHPDNSAAQIHLARVAERHGKIDEALSTLAIAASRDPQNVDIFDARARILLNGGKYKEARAVVDEAMIRFPSSVNWRERAIRLYTDSGDNEAAVRIARAGIVVYPRGAYLWFLWEEPSMNGKSLQAKVKWNPVCGKACS